MYPGSSLGHLSVQVASSGAIPYGIAASISLGIALAAVLAALSLKGRTGLPKLRSHQPSPLPGTVTGRSRPHLSMRDMATAHLVPMDAGEAGAAQAPASIDPSPGSSDPFEDTSGTSTALTSSTPPPTPAMGSDEIGFPQGDAVDGSL
jgi:hypothetical protein